MSDPLGLSPEQRMCSDLFGFAETLPERIERNRKQVEALPIGTIIHIDGFPAMTRELLLDQVLW